MYFFRLIRCVKHKLDNNLNLSVMSLSLVEKKREREVSIIAPDK